jgi:hypothetical protein
MIEQPLPGWTFSSTAAGRLAGAALICLQLLHTKMGMLACICGCCN